MANELSLSLTVRDTLGSAPSFTKTISATPGTADSLFRTLDSTTSATAFSFAPVTAPGQLTYIWNSDPTNYVDIAMDASVATPFARLLPQGIPVVIAPAASGTYYHKAHTATCKLVIFAA
jgi:hypothetical protein